MPSQRVYDTRKLQRRKMAAQQIQKLMDLAVITNRASSPELAERQAEIAWNLSTRFNVRLGERRLFFFCHSCKKFIVPPTGARIRLSRKRKSINITCVKCGSTHRRLF
ncbi:MAG: ribonuclease P protein component 4 [Nitrososphaerales archaeon]